MAKDILCDNDGDVFIGDNGITHTVEAEPQLIWRLLSANPGTIRHSPLSGCGIRKIPNSPITQDMIKRINMQLDVDGWTEVEVVADNTNLEIYANHK